MTADNETAEAAPAKKAKAKKAKKPKAEKKPRLKQVETYRLAAAVDLEKMKGQALQVAKAMEKLGEPATIAEITKTVGSSFGTKQDSKPVVTYHVKKLLGEKKVIQQGTKEVEVQPRSRKKAA